MDLLSKNKLDLTKRLSFMEGFCWNFMTAFGETAVSYFIAKYIGNSDLIAVFTTAPVAVGALFQIMIPLIFPRLNDRTQILGGVLIQIIGIFVTSISFSQDKVSLVFMGLGTFLYWIGGASSIAPWQNMMSQLIPRREHDTYFANRTALLSIVMLFCYILTGFYLNQNLDHTTVKYCFLIAGFFRTISLITLYFHPRVSQKSIENINKDNQDGVNIQQTTSNTNIWILALLMLLFKCSINISSPFTTVFLLNQCKYSVFMLSLLSCFTLITKIIFTQNWGSLLLNNAIYEGLIITSIFTSILPSIWVFSGNSVYVAFIGAIVNGLFWPGFELLSILLIYRLFHHNTTKYLSIFLALGSIGTGLGGSLGGILLKKGINMEELFYISSSCRFFTGVAFLIYLRASNLFLSTKLRIKYSLCQVISLKNSFNVCKNLLLRFR